MIEVSMLEFKDILALNGADAGVIFQKTSFKSNDGENVYFTEFEFEAICLNPFYSGYSIVQYSFNADGYTFCTKSLSSHYRKLSHDYAPANLNILTSREAVAKHLTPDPNKDLALSVYDTIYKENDVSFKEQQEWMDEFVLSLDKFPLDKMSKLIVSQRK